MNPQEIFDTVTIHLFKQGERSVDKHYCRYHNKDGLKCAIGALVSKEDYFPQMDEGNLSIKSLIDINKDKFPDWMKENLGLLLDLQSVHDRQYNWENLDNLYDSLVDVAIKYELSPEILDEVYAEEESYGE